VRPYTVDYRRQVEGDIARASADFIQRQAKAKQPFFLYVGWTHAHYPTLPALEFAGKSRIGPYGDAIMELDYRTGQVLDAIKAAGVENDTIVLWLSDNAAAPTSGPFDSRPGSNGPFRGELGDALEGSIRTVGMIKWPGRVAPRVSNEMVSVHDIFPTSSHGPGRGPPLRFGRAPVCRVVPDVDESPRAKVALENSRHRGVEHGFRPPVAEEEHRVSHVLANRRHGLQRLPVAGIASDDVAVPSQGRGERESGAPSVQSAGDTP
jgi:arylsulfatase A-like enzyme